MDNGLRNRSLYPLFPQQKNTHTDFPFAQHNTQRNNQKILMFLMHTETPHEMASQGRLWIMHLFLIYPSRLLCVLVCLSI